MDLKAQHVDSNSHPPLYLPLADTSPGTILTATAGTRFDVILLRPTGTWTETAELPIRNLSADPSFVFLWVGKGDDEGLEKGRECFAKWGFRRAEDIVWVKTNKRRLKADNSGLGDSHQEDEDLKNRGLAEGDYSLVRKNIASWVYVVQSADQQTQDSYIVMSIPIS
jgi:hypothetical protein